MELNARIFVAGGKGMVGSAIVRALHLRGHTLIFAPSSLELNLEDGHAVQTFFEHVKPEYVFLAAAKVGGIYANNTYRAEFIYSNLNIQTNVIHQAWKSGVKKLMFLGSSCIYPKHAPQPMKEEHLLTGPLEPTNEPYAIAKIAGIKMCQAYNDQYGTNFISVMPTNLYGPHDLYDPLNSHVLPALIRRFHEAKVEQAPEVVVWGTGTPLREFLYVDDLADACLHLMAVHNGNQIVNIGSGQEVSIAELARTVSEVIGYEGELRFDPTKPDGTPRKLLDVSLLKKLGWSAKTPLREGIRTAYQDFLATGGRRSLRESVAR
ncbi:MAG: GDP-L-fucose synthase [Candidatus Sumerlaeia bacterium]|nr:GDP-L-fucose synthase [Candidatus Sumerlaeia bacterium]